MGRRPRGKQSFRAAEEPSPLRFRAQSSPWLWRADSKMNPDLDTGHNTSAPAHWGELKNANFTGPNQTSSNSTLPQLDVTRAISVGLVLGAFILFAIVGNILVILSVACNRHLRTPTNYFIVNLAMADLLLSFTVLPFSAALEVLGYWVLGRIFCDIWAAVDVLCCTASILSLCAISIDRYIGVRYSLQYPTLVTRRKAILALLSVWVLSTVISIGPLLGWKEPAPNDDKECGVTEEPFYALFSSLGSFYIPLAVILVMYCRVYIVAKRTTKNLEAGVMKEMSNSKELTLRIHSKNFHEDPLSSTKAKGHNPRSSIAVKLFKFSREKKAAKTLGIVVGMFILCWLPFFIALPLAYRGCDQSMLRKKAPAGCKNGSQVQALALGAGEIAPNSHCVEHTLQTRQVGGFAVAVRDDDDLNQAGVVEVEKQTAPRTWGWAGDSMRESMREEICSE
ncbi:Alpha-1B adrenergic receptor [Plecturocebus cupreus]